MRNLPKLLTSSNWTNSGAVITVQKYKTIRKGDVMEIITYQAKYKQQIIDLILHIQNHEAKIGLSINEQKDLLDIPYYYQKNGGEFWTAVEDGTVIGTVALMNYGNGNAVLKKFFVEKSHRNQKVGYALYTVLKNYAEERKINTIVLDTPSVAKRSHEFYERAGFKKIEKSLLPFPYEYPDRDSYLYLLKL